MAPVMRVTVLSIVLATVGACSSGGGGGGGPPAPPPPSTVPFTSFGAITANQTVIMDGTAVTASGTQTSTAIQSIMPINPVGAGTVNLSYDGSRALSAISINTPQSSVTFDRNVPGHSVSCSGATCVGANATASGVAVDAFAVGWNYQTFGVWGIDTSPSTFTLGAISVGNPTSGNALPTTGPGNFTGLAAGFFFDNGGAPFATAATMNANVDFSQQRVVFSTLNTSAVNANTGLERPGSADLNLNGTLSYAPGVNGFLGTVTTAPSTGLTGQASGRFYGPAAEEIGGVYSLTGSGLSRMVGGFGGRR